MLACSWPPWGLISARPGGVGAARGTNDGLTPPSRGPEPLNYPTSTFLLPDTGPLPSSLPPITSYPLAPINTLLPHPRPPRLLLLTLEKPSSLSFALRLSIPIRHHRYNGCQRRPLPQDWCHYRRRCFGPVQGRPQERLCHPRHQCKFLLSIGQGAILILAGHFQLDCGSRYETQPGPPIRFHLTVLALEAARDKQSPIILQTSQGGAAYFAGTHKTFQLTIRSCLGQMVVL